MRCAFCSQINPANAKFCNECGNTLRLCPCVQCNAVNDIDATSCHLCGAALKPDAATTRVSNESDGVPKVVAAAPATPAAATESTRGTTSWDLRDNDSSVVRALETAAVDAPPRLYRRRAPTDRRRWPGRVTPATLLLIVAVALGAIWYSVHPSALSDLPIWRALLAGSSDGVHVKASIPPASGNGQPIATAPPGALIDGAAAWAKPAQPAADASSLALPAASSPSVAVSSGPAPAGSRAEAWAPAASVAPSAPSVPVDPPASVSGALESETDSTNVAGSDSTISDGRGKPAVDAPALQTAAAAPEVNAKRVDVQSQRSQRTAPPGGMRVATRAAPAWPDDPQTGAVDMRTRNAVTPAPLTPIVPCTAGIAALGLCAGPQ